MGGTMYAASPPFPAFRHGGRAFLACVPRMSAFAGTVAAVVTGNLASGVWLGGSCVARGRVPPVVGRPLAVCVWRQAGDYLAGTLLGS